MARSCALAWAAVLSSVPAAGDEGGGLLRTALEVASWSRSATVDAVPVHRAVEALAAVAARYRTPEGLVRAIFVDGGYARGGAWDLDEVLRTGGGNCVGLTTLCLAVAREAGLPVVAVSVPGHVFVRWDGDGRRRNIETTRGGREVTDEAWICRCNLPAASVESRAYLAGWTDDQFLAHLWAEAAVAERRRGERGRAEEAAARALALDAGNLKARLVRGLALLDEGDPRAAREEFERVLERDPSHAEALCARGLARLEAGDLEGAVRDCRGAAWRKGAEPVLAEAVAVACEAAGRHGRAAGWARRAKRLGVVRRAEGGPRAARGPRWVSGF
ncbi:MAG: tetratricopeptide repeat protein [Planctomycetes bacterium]|nr:tetratricopeptide repeat protein [Planctomycetota bacterium]